MRTAGTVVNRKSDKRLVQGEATRSALLAAARELFGERGYAATSTEEIVAAAGVTKGALYHHFGGKQELFRVVLEQVLHEVSDAVVAIFNQPDPWRDLVDGCAAWIDAHRDPAVRRIVLTDSRSVLDEEVVRDIENRFGAVAIRGALRKNRTAGMLEPAPAATARPDAHRCAARGVPVRRRRRRPAASAGRSRRPRHTPPRIVPVDVTHDVTFQPRGERPDVRALDLPPCEGEELVSRRTRPAAPAARHRRRQAYGSQA